MPESVMDPSYASGSRFNPNGIQMKLQHPTPPRIEGNIEKIGTSHDDVFQYRKTQSCQIAAKKIFKFWFRSFCSPNRLNTFKSPALKNQACHGKQIRFWSELVTHSPLPGADNNAQEKSSHQNDSKERTLQSELQRSESSRHRGKLQRWQRISGWSSFHHRWNYSPRASSDFSRQALQGKHCCLQCWCRFLGIVRKSSCCKSAMVKWLHYRCLHSRTPGQGMTLKLTGKL